MNLPSVDQQRETIVTSTDLFAKTKTNGNVTTPYHPEWVIDGKTPFHHWLEAQRPQTYLQGIAGSRRADVAKISFGKTVDGESHSWPEEA